VVEIHLPVLIIKTKQNIMKAIITIILVVFFGTFAFAQDAKTEVKVDTIEMGVVLSENVSEVSFEIEINNEQRNCPSLQVQKF
tara:strand:+ start:947 stop:1195 length:249 start_codon:yes stop_codon:yes gene_type:complete